MIEKINLDSKYLLELEKRFTDVFTVNNVKENIINNVFTNYFTYKLDNNYIAFINYDTIYERAELININVDKDYQNQKIATKLIEYMINDCIEKNIKSITLEVKETNENAIHLYTKLGFKQVGTRKGYYHGIDGLLMEKELI